MINVSVGGDIAAIIYTLITCNMKHNYVILFTKSNLVVFGFRTYHSYL